MLSVDIRILDITGGSMFTIKSHDDFVGLTTGDNLQIRLLAKYTDTILSSRQNLQTEKLSLSLEPSVFHLAKVPLLKSTTRYEGASVPMIASVMLDEVEMCANSAGNIS